MVKSYQCDCPGSRGLASRPRITTLHGPGSCSGCATFPEEILCSRRVVATRSAKHRLSSHFGDRSHDPAGHPPLAGMAWFHLKHRQRIAVHEARIRPSAPVETRCQENGSRIDMSSRASRGHSMVLPAAHDAGQARARAKHDLFGASGALHSRAGGSMACCAAVQLAFIGATSQVPCPPSWGGNFRLSRWFDTTWCRP